MSRSTGARGNRWIEADDAFVVSQAVVEEMKQILLQESQRFGCGFTKAATPNKTIRFHSIAGRAERFAYQAVILNKRPYSVFKQTEEDQFN